MTGTDALRIVLINFMNTAPLSLYFKYNRCKYNGNDKKFI
jgi:hypothetical protein